MSGELHNFGDSLQASKVDALAPYWERIYRHHFPAFASMAIVGDRGMQTDHVDRLITMANGHTVHVEEKVRSRDYPDFFLEYWSDAEQRRPGWIAEDGRTDFLAYVFAPSQQCHMLAFPALRRAWISNRYEWRTRFGARRVPNAGYTTVGCPVPISIVLAAVAQPFNFAEPRVAQPGDEYGFDVFIEDKP